MNTDKKAYATPKLTLHGDVENVTQGGVTGKQFDNNFQEGQPVPFNNNGQPIIFS